MRQRIRKKALQQVMMTPYCITGEQNSKTPQRVSVAYGLRSHLVPERQRASSHVLAQADNSFCEALTHAEAKT